MVGLVGGSKELFCLSSRAFTLDKADRFILFIDFILLIYSC